MTTDKRRFGAVEVAVRLDDDGKLDEVNASGPGVHVNMERMNLGAWCMLVYADGEPVLRVWLGAKRESHTEVAPFIEWNP